MIIDRTEEIEEALNEYNDIICINVSKESCDGIMEYDKFSDTWTCDQCGTEMNADDIMEEVEDQETELWMN